jgi:CheY-like chemotaxis protein
VPSGSFGRVRQPAGGKPGYVDVLVVDDDDCVRALFVKILCRAGYSVAEAEDSFVALEHLRSTPVAAMVLDVAMPGLDGLGLLDKLDDPPAVVMVSASDYDDEIMARRDKVSLYLQKPVHPAALLEALAQAISV